MKCIAYKGGYKYQLNKEYQQNLPVTLDKDIVSPGSFVILTKTGQLTLKNGYAWDGPSGPTIDTPNFMRGSLVHDALYQLMREGLLDRLKYRNFADRLLRQICIEDGMSRIRAWWVYLAVDFCAEAAAHPDNKKKVIKAPKRCY